MQRHQKTPRNTKLHINPKKSPKRKAHNYFLNWHIHLNGKLKGFSVFTNRDINHLSEQMHGKDEIVDVIGKISCLPSDFKPSSILSLILNYTLFNIHFPYIFNFNFNHFFPTMNHS